MKKIIIVLMLLALSVGMVGCGGGGSGSSSNPGGEKKGVPSVVQLLSTHSIAQTNSTVYLHTKVLDGNGVPVRNEAVTYTNLSEPFGVIKSVLNFLGIQKPLGLLSATVVKTNNLGIATVKLTSTTAGFATIQAEVNTGAGQVRDKRTIFFTTSLIPATPPPPTIALHVDDGNGTYDQPEDFNLFKGGSAADNQRSIKAVVKNGFGQPVFGATVLFFADSPNEVSLSASSAITNSDGVAVVIATVNPSLLANFERIVNILAGADVNNDDRIDTASMVSLFIQPVNVSSITVNANPSVVAPNGTSTVLATVRMLGTLPVPDGTAVAFETTCGFITPFAQTTNGIASATFTAPSIVPAGPCTVTAIAAGVSGTVNINVSISMNVQPGAQTINGVTGGTATYTIFGGVAPFTVTSNDPEFPAVLTGNIFTVTVPPNSIPKTVTYTVRDNTSAPPVTATLNIGGAGSLQVLPSTVTVDSASPEDTITFTIFGGVAPYYIFSNNPSSYPPSTPTVGTTGGTFTVTIPVDAPSGTVVMTVRDSNNPASTTTANITITVVAPQPLRVVPTVQTIGNPVVTNTAIFNILGGRAPYKAYSNNPVVVSVPEDVAGSTVLATVESVPSTDTTVTITIYDSLGTSVSGQLILDVPPILPMSVIPATRTLSQPTVGDMAQYEIIGGLEPYSAFSNNPGLATVGVSGSVLTAMVANVPTSDATVAITVYDSQGTTASASLVLDIGTPSVLSVTPEAVTVAGYTNPDGDPTDDITFYIAGGVPPYSMVSSNTAIIASQGAIVGSSFMVDPQSVSGPSSVSVTLTVLDSVGATDTVTVTVTPVLSFMEINPSNITVVHPTTIVYHILGGFGSSYPYFRIYPNELGVIDIGDNPLVTNSRFFTATTVAPGTVTLYIVDADGKTTSGRVTVVAGPAPPGPTPPAALSITLNPKNVIGVENVDADPSDNVTFTVTGGSPPYIVTADNPALAPFGTWELAASGDFDVTDVNNVGIQTSVKMTVVDNVGATASADLIIFPQASDLVISVNKKNVIGLQAATDEPRSADNVTFTVTGSSPPFIVALSISDPLIPLNFCMPNSVPCSANNGPWIIGASGGTQVIDPQSVGSSVTVTLTVTDNNGNIANTDFIVHPD